MRQLKKEDGTFTTSDTEILEEQYKYYRDLYNNENISEISTKIYLHNIDNINCLDVKESLSLEGNIQESECKEAIDKMKLNKSPGSDGLPVEFYKTFWEDIKILLTDSLNFAYQVGELSISQKRGILNLLYKKNDKTLLSNWRPISLLNTDYKILAHVLSNRLKTVLNKLINTDQSGYLKGRNISFNIRLIQDVIDYFEQNEQEGAILFLDFQKAFDTVSHQFLENVLVKFNFGKSFIRWVQIMYNKAESCVSNNGWTSRPFHIQKGIRQGCPLSALLFLLVVEVLASSIRKDAHEGLSIKVNNEIKNIHISQLADDTTLFLKDEKSVIKCLKKCQAVSLIKAKVKGYG